MFNPKTLAIAAVFAGVSWATPVTAQADEPMIGEIKAVAFNFCPRGWAEADGQLLAIASHQALFSLLGTQYGGDGRTTFGLPDLRGRSMVGVGRGPSLSHINQGQRGGSEFHTLNHGELPAHNHGAPVLLDTSNGQASESASGTVSLQPLTEDSLDNFVIGKNTADTGGSQPFNNRDPYLGMLHCVAKSGVFPSRE